MKYYHSRQCHILCTKIENYENLYFFFRMKASAFTSPIAKPYTDRKNALCPINDAYNHYKECHCIILHMRSFKEKNKTFVH